MVKISAARIFPLPETQSEDRRPPLGAAPVKIKGHPQISTLCLMATHELDHSGRPRAPAPFATGWKN